MSGGRGEEVEGIIGISTLFGQKTSRPDGADALDEIEFARVTAEEACTQAGKEVIRRRWVRHGAPLTDEELSD